MSNGGKADPAGIKFERNTVAVPRTDGMTVTFAGDDVTIAIALIAMDAIDAIGRIALTPRPESPTIAKADTKAISFWPRRP
jgi:hypothetical protein